MIRKQTITAQVIDYILHLIKQGRVKPGERLPTEKQLTETLSVSRTCVREAVKSLESMHLIKVRPRIGAVVLEPSQATLNHVRQFSASAVLQSADSLVEFRRILEVGLAGLAALKRTEAHLEAMRRALEVHERAAATGGAVHRADIAFHRAIAEASENNIAIMVMQTIAEALLERSRKLDTVPGVPAEGLIEHRRIYRAISERSAEKARRAMRDHIETQQRNAELLRNAGVWRGTKEIQARVLPPGTGELG